MANLPTGTVTFLFTDIEGSTRLAQQFPRALPAALARHHDILRQAMASHHGHVFQVIGDAFCTAFQNAGDGLNAAIASQRALIAEAWGDTPIRVRMGLHTGEAEIRAGDDYQGYLTLARVQRVMAAGHGGQTLVSQATAELVRDQLADGASLRDLGMFRLRGLTQPERIFQLLAPTLRAYYPPLRGAEPAESAATPLQQLALGQLVGRAPELEQLRERWSQALQSRGQLVLLSGEPGVGKTRLASELVSIVQQQGAAILRGGCYEFEATTPYMPFVEALRAFVNDSRADSLRVRLGGSAPELARLAPEIEAKLGPLTPSPAVPANEERLRLFDHVARFLRSLAAENGLLLFLDDLHWADQSTLAMLHYVVRNLRGERLLVLASYREVELDRAHPLAAALVEWNRERVSTRIALGRLTAGNTSALLARLLDRSTVSEEFAEAIHRETEGNPFFIEEVIKSLVEQGQLYREGDAWQRKPLGELAIPQSIKEAIGRRLNRLSAPCLDVLRTAAALGKIFPFAEIHAVLQGVSAAEYSEEALLDTLDEANTAQLIRADKGDSFAFTHDKIRETLYGELNPIRRKRLHRRIAEAQLRLHAGHLNAHASDFAFHFIQTGDLGQGLAWSLRAAQNASRSKRS